MENYWQLVKDRRGESAAAVTMFLPIATYLEKYVAKMSDKVFIISRIWNSGGAFLSVPLIMYGKSAYRKIRHIPEDAAAPIDDAVYGFLVGASLKTLGYVVAQESDLEKIAIAVGTTSAAGFALAPIAFYGADIFKDLVGIKSIKESRKRDPDTTRFLEKKLLHFEDWLAELPQRTKRSVAIGIAGLSLMTALGIWYNAPDNQPQEHYDTSPKIVSVVH